MKKIAMTGGGTAGHVNPNLALIPTLEKRGFDIIYIGSHEGIERTLIEKTKIRYFPIRTGKLRRYIDRKNITDMGRTILGVHEARKILVREKVDVVFSKGGFVSVPVVLGGSMCKIPVVIHESDYSPGLANKISLPFAKKVCVTFPETMLQIGGKKAVLTGNPVRASLFDGNKGEGLKICGFTEKKPVVLIMGGSLGSKRINECVRNILRTLLPQYNIAHICGKGNLIQDLQDIKGYCQFDYIEEELPHVLAAADIVVSRAGACAVTELLALKKPNLLIPLPKSVSRGDQILNAESFQKQGYSMVLQEESLTELELLKQLGSLYERRMEYADTMAEAPIINAITEITEVISEAVDNSPVS